MCPNRHVNIYEIIHTIEYIQRSAYVKDRPTKETYVRRSRMVCVKGNIVRSKRPYISIRKRPMNIRKKSAFMQGRP